MNILDHRGGEAQPKVLVLVLSHDAEPWRTIEHEGQRATWASFPPSGTVVRFYYGSLSGWARPFIRFGSALLRRARLNRARSGLLRLVARRSRRRPVREQDDRILVPIPEDYVTITGKTLLALDHVLNNYDFDFLLRTNTSSYVNLGVLAEVVKAIPTTKVYAGVINTTRSGQAFISGAGILMSRDVVQSVVNDDSLEFGMLDDVAIARSLSQQGVRMLSLGRQEFESLEQVDQMSEEALRSTFHYRCKVTGKRSMDTVLMRQVHARIKQLEAS